MQAGLTRHAKRNSILQAWLQPTDNTAPARSTYPTRNAALATNPIAFVAPLPCLFSPFNRWSGFTARARRSADPRCETGPPASVPPLTDRTQEIACFSYDDEHQYHPDGRSLRYYFPPRLGADLCQGFEQFRQLDDTADEHIDSLLKRLMQLEQESGKKVDADIVTWRGMMTKIMATPGDNMLGNG